MSLYNELKRRNVIRVAIAYLAGAWLLIEVAGTLFPAFGIPDWGVRFVVIVLALGFLPALIISWAYELTPEGLKREKDVVREASITHFTAKRLDKITIGLIAMAMVFIVADRFWMSPRLTQQVAAPVEAVTDIEQIPEPKVSESQYPINSIAVLPFVNMSSDLEQEYFSDGISEELLNLLTRIPELRVVARTSSFSLKGQSLEIPEIARRLQVSHVLEGSVRKSGNQVRITAQLIKTDDGYHLWSESYDRTLNDIFAVQDEIAAAVVAQLKVTLLGGTPMVDETNPETYELYLRANDYFNRGLGDPSIVIAAELYEQVLEIDPAFVLGHVGLAKAYSRIVFQGIDRTQKRRNQARKSIEMALQLDEELPAVLAAHGWYYYWVAGDYGRALKWFKAALEKLPYDSELLLGLGLAERRLAHWDDALRHLLLSFDLDPLSNEKAIEVGISYAYQHAFVEAVSHFQAAVALAPDQYRSYAHLAQALIGKDGAIDIALQALREGGDVIGRNEFIRRMLSTQPPWDTQMLMLSAFPEEFEELDQNSLTREQSIYYLVLRAEQYRRLGQMDSASVTAEALLGLVGGDVERYGQQVGLAYAHLGQRKEAALYLTVSPEEINIDARGYQSNVMMEAYGQLLLGSQDAAIERLDHALSVPGANSIMTILASPLWRDLRSHIKFQLLLSKYGH
jgi:adenylate cyclase